MNLVEHQAARIDPLVFLDRHFLDAFAVENGLRIHVHLFPEAIRVEAPAGSRLLDGRDVQGDISFSQALAVLMKP